MHIHNITTAQNMQHVYNLLDLDPMSPTTSDQQPISQTSSSLNDLLGFDPFSSLNTDLQGEEQKEVFQSEGSVSSPMDQSDAISDSLLLVDFGASEDPISQSTETEDVFSVLSSQGQTGFEIESGSTDGNVRLSETREGFDSFLLEPTEIGDQLIKRLDPSIHGNKDDHRQESFNVTDSDGSSLADLKKDDFQDEKEDKTVEEISGIQRDEEDKIEMPETLEILVSEKDSSDLLSKGSEEDIAFFVEKADSEREAGTLDELELNGELAEEKRGKFSSTIAPNNSFGDLDEYARTSTPQLDDDELSEKVEELHRSRSESLITNESQNEGDKITIKNLEMIATLGASGNEVQGEDAGEQTTISELKSFLGVLNGEEHIHGDDNSQSDDKGNDVGDEGLTWGTVEEDGAHTEENEDDDVSGQSSDAPLLSEGALSNDRESAEHIIVHERPTQSEIGIEIEAGKSDSDLKYSSDNADSSDHCPSEGDKDTRQGSFDETSQQNSSFAMFTSKVGTSEKFDVQESDNGSGASDCGGTINDDKSLSSDQNEMDMMDEKKIDDETNEDDSMTISVDLQVNSLQELHSEYQHHIAEKMQFGQTEKVVDHFFTPESDELSYDNQNLRGSEDHTENYIIEDESMNKFAPDDTEDDERSSQEQVDEEGIDGGLVGNALSNPSIIEVGLTSGSDVSSRGEQDNIGDFSSMMSNEHDDNEISSIFGDTSFKSSLLEVDTQNFDENESRGQTKENIQTNPFANEVDELFNVNENLTTEQDGTQVVPFEHELSSEMITGTTNDQKFDISVESTSEITVFEEPKQDTHKNMYERGSQVQLESSLQTNPFGVGELSNGKRSFRAEDKDILGDEIIDISTGGTSDVIPVLQHKLKVHETNYESQSMGNPQTNPFVGEMKIHSDRNPFMETDKEDISDQDLSCQMMQTSDDYAMVESSVDTSSFASPSLLLIKGDEHQDQEKFIEGPADQHRQTNPFDVEMGGLFDEKLISNSDQGIWDPEKSVMQGIGGSSFVSYSQEDDTGDHSHTEEEQITALYEGNLESNPFTSGSGLFYDPSSKADENTNGIEIGADELVASKEITNHEKSPDWKPPVPSDGNQLDGEMSKTVSIEVFETGYSSEEEGADFVDTTKEKESLEMVGYDKDDEDDTEVSPETMETGELVLNGNPNTPFVFDMSNQQVEEKGLIDIMAVEETENQFGSDDMDKTQEHKPDSEEEKNRGSITVSEEGLTTEVPSSERDSNADKTFDFLPDVDVLPSKSVDDTVIEDQHIVEENENSVCSTRQEGESQKEIDQDDMDYDGNDALLELSVTSKKVDKEMAEHQVEMEDKGDEDVVKELTVESLEVHPTVYSLKDVGNHKDQESQEMDRFEEDSVEEEEKPREVGYNDMGFNDSSQFTISDGNEALLELSVASKKEEQELAGHQEMEQEDEDVIKEQAVESLQVRPTVHSSKDLEIHKDQESQEMDRSEDEEEEKPREVDSNDLGFKDSSQFTIKDDKEALLELSVTSKKEDQEMTGYQEMENEVDEDVVKEEAVEPLEVHPTVLSPKDVGNHKDEESQEMDRSEDEEEEKPREVDYNDMDFNDSSQFTIKDDKEALLELSVTSKKEDQEMSEHQEMEDEDEVVVKEQAVDLLEAHLTVHSPKKVGNHKDQESQEMDRSEADSAEEEEEPREVDYNDMGFNDSFQLTINDGNDALSELSVTSKKEEQELAGHQEMEDEGDEDVVKEEVVEPLEAHPTVHSSKDLEYHKDQVSHEMDRSEDEEEEKPREVDYNDMDFNDSSQFTINNGNDALLELSVTSKKEDQEMSEHQEMEDEDEVVVKEQAVDLLEAHLTVHSPKKVGNHKDQESQEMDRSEEDSAEEDEEPREVDYNDMGFNDSFQLTINDGNDALSELSVTSKKEEQELAEHKEMEDDGDEDVGKEEVVEPLEAHPTVHSSKDLEYHKDQVSHEMDRSEEEEEEEKPREVDYNDMGFNDSCQLTINDGNDALSELSVTSKKEEQELSGHQEMEDEGDEDVVKEEVVEPLEAHPTVHSSKDLEYHKDQVSHEMDRSEDEEEEKPREVDYNDMDFNDSSQFTINNGNDALLELSVTSKKEDQEMSEHQEMEDEDEVVVKEQAVDLLEAHLTVHSPKKVGNHKDQESQEMDRSEEDSAEEDEEPREVDYNDMGFNDSFQLTINDGNDALSELSVTSKKEEQELAEHKEMEDDGDEDVGKEEVVEPLEAHPTVHSSKDLEYHKDQVSHEMDRSEEEEEEKPREVDYNDMGFNDSSQFTINDGHDALLVLSVTSMKEAQGMAEHQVEMEQEDIEDVVKEQAVESLEAHLTVLSSKDLEYRKDQVSHEMDRSDEVSAEEEEKPREVDYNDMGFIDSSQFTVNNGNDAFLELSLTSKKEDQEMTGHQEMENEDEEDVIKEEAVKSLEAHLTVHSSKDLEYHKDEVSQQMDRSEDEEEEKPREVDYNDMEFNDSSQFTINDDGNDALLELSVTSKKEDQETSEYQEMEDEGDEDVVKEEAVDLLEAHPTVHSSKDLEYYKDEESQQMDSSEDEEEEKPREVDYNDMEFNDSSQFTINDDGNDALLELSVKSKKEDQETSEYQEMEDEGDENVVKEEAVELLEAHPIVHSSKDLEYYKDQVSHEMDRSEDEEEKKPREVNYNDMEFNDSSQFTINDGNEALLKLSVTSKKEEQELAGHHEMEDDGNEDVVKEEAVDPFEAHPTVHSSKDLEYHTDQESQEMDRSEEDSEEEEEKPREVDYNDMGFNDSSQLTINDGNDALLELSVTSKKEDQEISEHKVEKESLNVQLTLDPSMDMNNHEEQELNENNRDEEVSSKPEEENPREVDHNEMDYAYSSQFTINDDGNYALLELSVTSKKEDQEITGHQIEKEDEHEEEVIKKQTVEPLEVHPTADLSKDVENHQEQESFEIDGDEEGSIEEEENPREVDHNEMDFKHEYQFVVNDEERDVLKLTDDLNLLTVEHKESQLDEVAVFVEDSVASDERVMDTMEESKEVDAGGEHGVIKLDDGDFKVSTGGRTTEYEDEVNKMSIKTEDYCIISEIIDGIISQIVGDKMENDLVTRERTTENALFKREAEEEQENAITSTHNKYPQEEITRKVEEMNPESCPSGMKQDDVSLSYKKPVQISSNFSDLEAKQFELSLKPPGSIVDEEVTSPVLSDLSESGVDMSPNHQSSSPKVRPSSLSLSDLSINSNKGASVALAHMDTPTILSPSLDSLSSYSHEGYFASPDFEDDTPTPGMSDVKSLRGMETDEPAYKRALSVDSELNRNVNRGWSDNQSLLDAILLTQKSREELTEETPQAEADMSADADQHGAEDKTTDEAREAERGEAEGAEEDDMDNISIKITRKDPPSITPEVQALVDEADGGRGRLDTLLSDTSIGDFDYGDDDDDDDEDESDREAKGAYSGAADSPNRKRLSAELALNLEDGTSITTEIIDAAYPAVLTPSSTEMSWDDDTSMDKKSSKPEKIAEYTAREEHEDRWRWRTVKIGDTEHMVDNKVIEPFKKVLSHGGYYGNTMNAVIVIASCYLPEKSRKDYEYVMHNLFLYVVSSLELLVAQDYIIVYFHGAAPRTKIPSLAWMKRCYQMIDRRLKKNLKGLYIIHPTGWLKTVITFTRPFISAKFYRKLKFIYKLSDLKKVISMEYIYIPEEVKRLDRH
ncbi:uncharacterized protein [Apostichopus japonicus]|uniref:uncharacterized protein isoform X3 n=1 Tax=Stichopus japonicus TaxID=307972 RepID=UPI003AB532FC